VPIRLVKDGLDKRLVLNIHLQLLLNEVEQVVHAAELELLRGRRLAVGTHYRHHPSVPDLHPILVGDAATGIGVVLMFDGVLKTVVARSGFLPALASHSEPIGAELLLEVKPRRDDDRCRRHPREGNKEPDPAVMGSFDRGLIGLHGQRLRPGGAKGNHYLNFL
jgi:hypothetical protein